MEIDVCCGYKAMWKGMNIDDVIFVDKRRECKPTVIADAKFLPFRVGVFDKIYCDPPHLIQKNYYKEGAKAIGASYFARYGNFENRAEWETFLKGVNVEFERILVNSGLLWFKITDGEEYRITKKKDMELLTNFEPVTIEEMGKKRAGWSHNKTFVFNMIKKSYYDEQVEKGTYDFRWD